MFAVCAIHLIVLLKLCFAKENEHLCRASNLIELKRDGLFVYPVDLFAPQLLNKNEKRLECHSEAQPFFHNCSSNNQDITAKNFCPLHDINIEDASLRSEANLCDWRENMLNESTISRVIVFGLSVTVGHHTTGCCCNRKFENACDPLWNTPCSDENYCNWTNYLKRFIESLASKNKVVKFYNLAVSGMSSITFGDYATNLLKQHQISGLNSGDLILLDYSVNDATFMYPASYVTVEQELERGIRSFYFSSINNSWPTIVLLEFAPYSDGHVASTKKNPNNKLEYSTIYTKIAKYYKLPIWSFRDMLWSDYTKANQSGYVDYLLWLKNNPVGDYHPPWFVHLFYADLIAGIISREFEKCTTAITSNHSKLNKVPSDMDFNALLPALNKNNKGVEVFCDFSKPLIMDISSEAVFHNTATNIGTYTATPIGSWKFFEDRPGKRGWISEFPPNIPDRSITNTIVFSSEIGNDEKGKAKRYVLRIVYMKTYKNAGRVSVFSCKEGAGAIDTLWNDQEFMKYSEILVATFDISVGTCNGDKAEISLVHQFVDNSLVARQRQKVKIIDITVC